MRFTTGEMRLLGWFEGRLGARYLFCVAAWLALFCSTLPAQPEIGERIELKGQVAELSPGSLRVQTPMGVVVVSLGMDRIELPGGFLSEPGRIIDFNIMVRETTGILQPGQFVRFQAECDPTTLMPAEAVDELDLLPEQLGIKSSWQRLDEPAVEGGGDTSTDVPTEENVDETETDPARFERRLEQFEIIGLIQKVEANAVLLKVGTRRVRVPIDDETVVAFDSTDSRLLSIGDEVDVVGRRLGPAVLASRIRARHVAASLVAVVQQREQAEPVREAPAAADPATPAPMPGDPSEPRKVLGGVAAAPAELREGPAPPGKYFGRRLKIN